MISQWNSALLTLHELGWQIEFDAQTYPEYLRPEWGMTNPKQSKLRPRNWLATWLKAAITIQPTVLIQERLRAAWVAKADEESEPLVPTQAALKRSRAITGSDLSIALEGIGWSKAQLAKKLGVDRSLITRWVKGERAIQPKHQKQLRALLNV